MDVFLMVLTTLVVVFILAVLVFLSAKAMLEMAVPGVFAPTHPACGKCRYNVRNLGGLQCPECGSDLLEVGIIGTRPKQRPITTIIAGLIGWTLAVLVGWLGLFIIASRFQTVGLLLWVHMIGAGTLLVGSVGLFALRFRNRLKRTSRIARNLERSALPPAIPLAGT